ncbi:MAG TPA: hypothetical protein VNJ03_14910 [Vicinamibacterales bacterium]|nr:hypothetical protein [Vicinamibacterales bacterium]
MMIGTTTFARWIAFSFVPAYLCGVSVVGSSGASVLFAKADASEASVYVSGPSAAALAVWTTYAHRVEATHAHPGPSSFFALTARGVATWRDRAVRGSVPMVEVTPPSAPDATIHHWVGAIYIPNATVAAVVTRMQEHAGRESEFYEEVKVSKLLQRDGNRLKVFLRLQRDAGVVKAEYNTEHAVEYRTLGDARASSRSVSTKIAELDEHERERPQGQDRGFLWRLNAYWRFEQAGTGVLIECESVSLSRGVPWLVRPVASPIVNRIARESLERTLRSLRAFLSRPT